MTNKWEHSFLSSVSQSQEEGFEDTLSSGAHLSGETFFFSAMSPESTLPSHREWRKSPKVSCLIFRQIMRWEDLGLWAQPWVWILIHIFYLSKFISSPVNGRDQYGLHGKVSRSEVTCGCFLPARRSPLHPAVITNLRSAWHTVEIWKMGFPPFLSHCLPLLGRYRRAVILSVGGMLEDRQSLSYLTPSQADVSVHPKSSTSVPLSSYSCSVWHSFLPLYALLILLCQYIIFTND